MDSIVQQQMLKSPTLSKVIFFCVRLARAVGNRVWDLMEKTKEKAESVLFLWNTLYQGDGYKWSLSSSKITTASCVSELAALCLHCHVPVPGRFSRVSCRHPRCVFLCSTVIPMAIWNPSDPAHVKWVKYLGTSQCAEIGGPDSETFGWSCPVGICSDIGLFFFLWKWSKTDVLRGVVPALILSGWHTGYAAPLPHLDSDSSVYLGISRSLMNDLEIKLKQKQPKRFYCLKGFVGGKFKAFSGGALYGSLTNESCWLTVTRSLCLSPYFYLWAYLLFMISCCVTEYFS